MSKQINRNSEIGIILCCILMMAVVYASSITFPGVFVIPVANDLGVSRAAVSLYTTITTLSSMVTSLLIGRILEYVDFRRVLLVFGGVSVICYMGYASAAKIWHFYVLSVAFGICAVVMGPFAVSLLIKSWIPPERRGRALGVAMSGSGIGSLIMTPLLTWINSNFGWRLSYGILGVLTLFLVLPFVFRYAYIPKQAEIGNENATIPLEAASGLTVQSAMRTGMFWAVIAASVLYGFNSDAFGTAGYSYYCDLGYPVMYASLLMTLASGALIIGKLILGAVCDKYGSRTGALLACSMLLVGHVFAIAANEYGGVIPVLNVLTFGLGNSIVTIMLPLMASALFGNRDYVKILSLLQFSGYIGTGAAPVFASYVFDTTGSYLPVWYICSALIVVMTLLTLCAYKMRKQSYSA